MTPAQLAQKRTNDREGQRAFRKRTKETIENLKVEVERLRGLNLKHGDAEALLQENQALRNELHILKTGISPSVHGPISAMQLCNSCHFSVRKAIHLADELMFLQILIIPCPWCVGVTKD